MEPIIMTATNYNKILNSDLGLDPERTGTMKVNPVYGIVGGGRMAKHFHYYLRQQQNSVLCWTRQSITPPEIILDKADIIIILIKDSEIEAFISNHPKLQNKTLIHFSGSLSSHLAFGFHPLMSFTPDLYEKEFYIKIPFIVDECAPDFQTIFPNLPNPSYRIREELKSLYHALCVLAGNGMAILWQKFFNTFESHLSLPKEVGFAYLEQVTQNLQIRPEQALTGPLVRQDHLTIRKNLESLAGDPFAHVYQALYQAVNEQNNL